MYIFYQLSLLIITIPEILRNGKQALYHKSRFNQVSPVILKNSQEYIRGKRNTGEHPVNFVFHGGSGSSLEEIREAIGYGVVKMNIDTDTQWAFWDGVRAYEKQYHDYLQGQLGNPEGEDKPNKKYYDPRKWLREGEKSMAARVKVAFSDLNCIGRN